MDHIATTQRVALVTGSASGLLRGVCVSLARHGYAVAANYRQPRSDAYDTITAIRAAVPNAVVQAFEGDVSGPESAAALVAAAHRAFGRVDVLVCGAGPIVVKDAYDTTLAEYRDMVEGNLGSTFFCIKAALPIMRTQQFGRIVTFGMTGSDAAMGARHMSLYAAAKAGVIALTRSIALEEAQHGITCNAVNVGDIRDKDADRETARQRRTYRNPTTRPGSWEDVGDAVVYLASDQASFVNGAVLPVNGGWQGFLAEHSRWP